MGNVSNVQSEATVTSGLFKKERGLFYANPPFADFPRNEYVERLEKVRKFMQEDGIDLLALWAEENVRYFTGFNSIHWSANSIQPAVYLIPLSGEPLMIIPEFFRGNVEGCTYVNDIRSPMGECHLVEVIRGLPKVVGDAIKQMGYGKKRIGIEAGRLGGMYIPRPYNDIKLFLDELSSATIVNGADTIWKCRLIKSPLEIETMRTACAFITEAFSEFVEYFRLGMSEKEAGQLLTAALVKRGLKPEELYFTGNVQRYAMVDSPPEFPGVPLNRGDRMVVEALATYKGYYGSLDRTFQIGDITEKHWEIIRAVEDGQRAAISVIKDGIRAKEIIAAVSDSLAEKGFKSTGFAGHGVGLIPHEPPDLTSAQEIVIREGMVLAIEVWFYDVLGFTRGGRLNQPELRTNLGIFSNEDLIVVTKDGAEMLPNLTKEIRTLPRC